MKKMNSNGIVVHSVDMTSMQGSKPNYFRTSKALGGKLKHCEKPYLLNESGTMSLGNSFAELDWQNPLTIECHHQTLQHCCYSH